MSQPGPRRRHVTLFLAARLVFELADDLMLTGDPAIERELLERSRQLTGVLEKKLRGRRGLTRKNVIDLQRLKSRRTLAQALDNTAPDPRPPRAA
jgi:hypothetical protein